MEQGESAALVNSISQSFDGSRGQIPQATWFEAMEKLPSLGLKLSHASFLEKLDQLSSQKPRISGEEQGNSSGVSYAMTNENVMQQANKMKAENFNISMLRIGSWQRVSRNEGDLVGKCYFAKKKLVWEYLENGLKRKIEIQWSDVLSLRAVSHEAQSGILELELTQPPSFYHEQDPQPRKHTQWRPVADFTGLQASTYRRHYLEFPPGALDRPLDKLLSYDQRLCMLSRQGFPVLDSPFFSNQRSRHFSFDFGRQMYITPHQQQQQQQQQTRHVSFANVPTHYQTFEPAPLSSPLSVMEFSKYRSNQMSLLDGQGRVINVGDDSIPNQIRETTMPMMPIANQIRETTMPMMPIANQIRETTMPMMLTANQIRETTMPMMQTTNQIRETTMPMMQTTNQIRETMMPMMSTADATTSSIPFQDNGLPPLPHSEFEELVPLQQPPMFRTLNDQHQNMLLDNSQIGFSNGLTDADFFLQGHLGSNTDDILSPNTVDDNGVVLMNNGLLNNVDTGAQQYPIPSVSNWTPDNSPFSSAVNSDNPFNHEIDNWTHDFSHNQWQ